MASEISYFFLIGLISFINGKPADNGYGPYAFESLLKELTNQQGKYDIALSHHEDGPRTHHEDTAVISSQNSISPSKGKIYEKLGDLPVKSITPVNIPKSSEETTVLIGPPPTRQGNCNARCREVQFLIRKGKEYDNVDEVLEFLSELDSKFGDDNYARELRCAGRSCSRSRSVRDNNQNQRYDLRCRGKTCSRSRDDRDDSSRNVWDFLRCIGNNGNRCSLNGDTRENRDNLRCSGNRCSIARDDSLRIREDLRCSGERCSITRSDRNHEVCIGDKCNIRDSNYRDDIDNLRCSSNKCSIDNNDRDDDSRVRADNLRCRGRSCAASRFDNDDDNVRYGTQAEPINYRGNENLDAIVLDMSNLDRVLSNGNNRNNKLAGARILENVDLDSLLINTNDRNSDVEAAVYDLEKRSDRNALSRQLKRLLSQGIELSQ